MNNLIERLLNSETEYDVVHNDIKSLLKMKDDVFEQEVTKLSRDITRSTFGENIAVSGLLAFHNNCYEDCTYCGLRRSNKTLPRYRISIEDIKGVIDRFSESGLERIFLVSGEDKKYPVKDILLTVSYAKEKGLHVNLGLGEYPVDSMKAFKDAGTDCYTLKFETSNLKTFQVIKPTTTYEKRMNCIHTVKSLGMELGSGNIVGIEGQTIDDLASDILLMRELDIDWAPIVPYLPAPGTPMAERTPMGNVLLTLRVLSLVRILLPKALITGSQPSQGTQLGFADPEGNKNALNSGANVLFVDMTPHAVRKNFQVTAGRILPGLVQIDRMLENMDLTRIKKG